MKTYSSSPRFWFAALCVLAFIVTAHAQVSQTIGTLEPGQSVTITYEVTINDPLSPAITQISSQGAVSGSNFTAFNTDDPETAALNDVTITSLPNDPPVVDLNGGGAGNDVAVTFTEQTPALVAPAGTITDPDGDDIVSVIATLVARPDGDGIESLSLNASATTAASGAGLTTGYNAGTGELSITGAAAASVYQTVLQGILYGNTSDNPATSSRSVTVVASDGNPGISRTSTVSVSEVNDPPVAGDDSLGNVPEDSGTRVISFALLLANDTKPAAESAQTLTIVSVSNPVGGTVSIVGTDVRFTPAADFNGAASFEYTVQDNGTTAGVSAPLTDTGAVTFTIVEVNDPPVAVDDALAGIAEDSGARTIPFAALLGNDSRGPADENGQSLTIASVSNPVGGTVAIVGGDVIFTPAADFNGPASFDYVARDNGTTDGTADPLTDTGSATFAITEVNDPPIAVDDGLASIAEDSSAQTIPFANLVGNDARGPANEAGQTLNVISVANPVGGTVAIVGTDVIFTPTADYNGPASFDYVVEDNGTTGGAADPLTDTGSASFTIVEINDPPVAVDDVLTDIAEDSGARAIPFADLLGNDSKGPANESSQTLIITTVSNPVGGTVAIVGTDVIFTPTADYNGPASFDYVVEDNGLSDGSVQPRTDTGSVSFTITPVAEAPAITSATTAEDTQTTSGLVITPSAVDGAEITHFRISATTGGTVFQADGTTPIPDGSFITIAEGAAGLRFTPLPDLNSPAGSAFSFVAEGAAGDTGAGLGAGTTATITVSEVNDPPVAIDETILPIAEDSVSYTIAFADLIANDGKGRPMKAPRH